jgi:ParB/RepB/Spo0J family partition protein
MPDLAKVARGRRGRGQSRTQTDTPDESADAQQQESTPPASDTSNAAPTGGSGVAAQLASRLAESRTDERALIVHTGEIEVRPQIRQHFDDEALTGLADTIERGGQLDPITIRYDEQGSLVLVDGERRLRAMLLLQERDPTNTAWHQLRATRQDSVADDNHTSVQLIANIQREQLTVLEEARALATVREDGESVRALARRVGKATRWVGDRLQLLELDADTLAAVDRGELSPKAALERARDERADPGSTPRAGDSQASAASGTSQGAASRRGSSAKVSLSADTVQTLAHELATLADALGLAPIDLGDEPDRRTCAAALEQRGQEVMDAARARATTD